MLHARGQCGAGATFGFRSEEIPGSAFGWRTVAGPTTRSTFECAGTSSSGFQGQARPAMLYMTAAVTSTMHCPKCGTSGVSFGQPCGVCGTTCEVQCRYCDFANQPT